MDSPAAGPGAGGATGGVLRRELGVGEDHLLVLERWPEEQASD